MTYIKWWKNNLVKIQNARLQNVGHKPKLWQKKNVWEPSIWISSCERFISDIGNNKTVNT